MNTKIKLDESRTTLRTASNLKMRSLIRLVQICSTIFILGCLCLPCVLISSKWLFKNEHWKVDETKSVLLNVVANNIRSQWCSLNDQRICISLSHSAKNRHICAIKEGWGRWMFYFIDEDTNEIVFTMKRSHYSLASKGPRKSDYAFSAIVSPDGVAEKELINYLKNSKAMNGQPDYGYTRALKLDTQLGLCLDHFSDNVDTDGVQSCLTHDLLLPIYSNFTQVREKYHTKMKNPEKDKEKWIAYMCEENQRYGKDHCPITLAFAHMLPPGLNYESQSNDVIEFIWIK